MRILEPGTFLHAVPVKPGPITVMERAEAEVPCRTHLSVLDMRRFEPGVPGGGGIGHAIDLRARAVVRLADEWTVRSSRPHVVEHAARVVAGAAGYGGALEVEAEDHGIRHLGLGSTSALMTAVAVAVNHVLGRPLGSRDLRHIIGRNFVEDHPEGVVPGFETGVGPAVGLYGGFIVMTDALAIASRMSLPDGWQAVIAVVHGDPRKSSGEEEISLLMNRARDLDASAAERKAHLALLDLIPAMDAGDLDRMTGVIARLQRIGSKVAEIEHHPRPDGIRSLAESMRDAGARLVGMSSVGPSVTGIVPEERAEAVAALIEDTDIVERGMIAPVNNTGYTARVE